MKNLVIVTGVSFEFVKGNASTNLAINVGKAYENLGYEPLIIPQNPSYNDIELRQGVFEGLNYRYPLRKKNLFSKKSRVTTSLNYRLGIIVNSIVTGVYIWKNRKYISHIFSQTLRPINIFILGMFCRISGVKFVYHMVEEPWTLLKYADMPIKRKFLQILQQAIPTFLLYFFILRLPNNVTCITNELIGLLRKFGYRKKTLSYLPSVRYNESSDVMVDNRTNDDNSQIHNIPRIIYTGQISQTKESFDKVFDAVQSINSETKKIEFYIYGGGEALAVESFKAYLKQRKLGDQVVFKGFVSRKELQEAQEKAFLCVLMKRNITFNRYNFPTKLLDYLNVRKPILISNLPVHEGLFTNKLDAIIVNPDSSKQIEEALLWALDNPEELKKIGDKAYNNVMQKLDAKQNMERLLKEVNISKLQ